jgi:hypothetical protein
MNRGVPVLRISQGPHHPTGAVQTKVHHLHLIALLCQIFQRFTMVHGFKKEVYALREKISKSDAPRASGSSKSDWDYSRKTKAQPPRFAIAGQLRRR